MEDELEKILQNELAEFEALVEQIKGNCDKCKMDCLDRLQIIDSQLQAFFILNERLEQRISSVDEMLVKLEAMYQRNLRFLNLHREEPIGQAEDQEEWQKEKDEKSSSQSRMLKQYAKSTH